MGNGRFYNSLRNFIMGLFSTLVGIVIPFFARTLIIKYIGENYLGLNSLFASIFHVINFANLGFASAIGAYLYRPIVENDTKLVNQYLTMLVRINYFLAILVLVFGSFAYFNLNSLINVDTELNVNIKLIFLLNLFDLIFNYLFKSYSVVVLNATQRSDIWNTANCFSRLFFGVIQLLIIVFIKKMEPYVLMTSFVTIINRIVCAYYCKKLYPFYKPNGKFNRDIRLRLLKDSLALGSQKIGNSLATSLDNIVISKCLNLSYVAKYGNYNYIVTALTMISSNLSNAILAAVGQGTVSNNKEKLIHEFKLVYLLYILSGVVICSTYFVCVQNFIYIWIGDSFLPMIDVLLISLVFFFNQGKNVLTLFKDATANWRKDQFRPLISGVLNLIINVILVKIIGITGVILSTLLTLVLIDLPWESIALFSSIKIKELDKYYYVKLIKMFFATITIILITNLLILNLDYSFFSLLIRLVISLVVNLIVLYMINRNDNEFITLIKFLLVKCKGIFVK